MMQPSLPNTLSKQFIESMGWRPMEGSPDAVIFQKKINQHIKQYPFGAAKEAYMVWQPKINVLEIEYNYSEGESNVVFHGRCETEFEFEFISKLISNKTED